MALRNYLSALRLNFLENLSATPSVIFVWSKKRNATPDTNEALLEKTGKNKEKPNKTIGSFLYFSLFFLVFLCFSYIVLQLVTLQRIVLNEQSVMEPA